VKESRSNSDESKKGKERDAESTTIVDDDEKSRTGSNKLDKKLMFYTFVSVRILSAFN